MTPVQILSAEKIIGVSCGEHHTAAIRISIKTKIIKDGQCHSTTKVGIRCKNKTTGLYCYRHEK